MLRIQRARGFTLFEAAISLALVSLAVTGTMILLPAGLKAQRLARFQLLAAAKAEELVELFIASANTRSNIDAEATRPWEVPAAFHGQAADLEARLASAKVGVAPVPAAIARRLDSDGDEIARLLDAGGQLLSCHPSAAGGLEDQVWLAAGGDAPTEAARLVFAVRGPAQQNAITVFPWKAWPYYAGYPSPPIHCLRLHDADLPSDAIAFAWPQPSYRAYCFEGAGPAGADGVDPDAAAVFAATGPDGAYGFQPYAYRADGTTTRDGAVRYVQAALRYALRAGVPPAFYDPPTGGAPLAAFTGAVPRHRQVQAMRFLAHAAMCLTRWCTLDELGGQPSAGVGVLIPPATVAGTATPELRVTHDRIRWYHESCLALAMRFAAEDPYDWGAPRPLQRALMTDHPLLQWDLFSPPLAGPIAGAGGEQGAQWRPLSASPVRNAGVSMSYPAAPIPDSIWGDAAHFTLTDPFTLAERCRELVFWAVDWHAYEDCETCPSAPVDASRYNLAAPLPGVDLAGRMSWLKWSDPHLYGYRNPEKNQMFWCRVDDRPTGARIDDALLGSYFAPTTSRDQGGDDDAKRCFSGLWGADRDFDGVLDRGPVPRTARLRAAQVGRFLFYDPRLPLVLR